MKKESSLSFKNIFKRETKLASYIIICLTVVVLSLSYAMFFQVNHNSKNQIVTAGDLKFTYTDGTEITTAKNSKCLEPMNEDEALLYSSDCGYQFSIQNTGTLKGSYTLKLLAKGTNVLETSKIKVIIKQKVGETLEIISGYPKTVSELVNSELITSEIDTKTIIVFSVQLYVDEELVTEEDTAKAISYQIEGTGLVHEDQPINTTFQNALTECKNKGGNGANCLLEAGVYDPENLAYDNTVDNNLRYIGKDPNNYVTFNNELWRIIGVMNNVEDGSDTKAPRIKLIKESKIGIYSWDNKANGTGSSTSEWGSNDWSDSALQEVLNNGAYYNRTSGTCPYGQNGATTACDFTSNGLTPEAKTMIENIKWNLGGSSSTTDVTASMFYERERGTTVSSGRPTEWIGQVGLMYPSDYGYATSGGATTNRETCLVKELWNWNIAAVSDCKNNDWLYDSSNWQWTLSPYSDDSYGVLDVGGTGFVDGNGNAYYTYGVSPAVYLLSEIKISSGNGTKLAPYTLSLS